MAARHRLLMSLAVLAIATQAAPAKAATLVIGRAASAATLDPGFLREAATPVDNVFDTLVARDAAMKLAPGLALSWSTVNETTWEFKLRPGVLFQNGEPFTAAAVKVSLERVLDPAARAPTVSYISTVAGVRVDRRVSAAPFLWIDGRDVLAAGGADIPAAISDIRAALAALRDGDAEMPAETSVRLGGPTGTQSRAYALAALFPRLERVTVWNRTVSRADAMVSEVPTPFPCVAEPMLGTALADADAVLACTNAATPILPVDVVRPGRSVLQVGYHEVPFDAIDRADAVLVDLWGEFRLSSAKSLFQMHRAGRFEAGRVAADLAALVLDGWRPKPDAAVYFSSFGLNLFDVALAARVLRRAAAMGFGSRHAMAGAVRWPARWTAQPAPTPSLPCGGADAMLWPPGQTDVPSPPTPASSFASATRRCRTGRVREQHFVT